MITVNGDSMEPLFYSGDEILIDVSRQVPVLPSIFVIWDGTGLVTKRIEQVSHSEPSGVVIKSANPAYESYERHRRGGACRWTCRCSPGLEAALGSKKLAHSWLTRLLMTTLR